MNSYLYFPNKRPHKGLHNKLQNLFTLKDNSFQRKHELITSLTTPFLLQQSFVRN